MRAWSRAHAYAVEYKTSARPDAHHQYAGEPKTWKLMPIANEPF